nr:hypothetical protein [Paenibacillus terrae]
MSVIRLRHLAADVPATVLVPVIVQAARPETPTPKEKVMAPIEETMEQASAIIKLFINLGEPVF